MGDSTNVYYASTPSRIPHTRHPSLSDEENILPQIWAPLHCEATYHSYLAGGENATQNISVQFMHPCPGQDAAQLDPDILPGRPPFSGEPTAIVCHPIAYPESSQRTTSSALSAYASDASPYHDVSPYDLAALHIVDAPLHAQAFRRGSWPSHTHAGHPTSTSPPRATGSPASEPPESTSDGSYPDSDGEEVTKMSPMMNQFQIQSLVESTHRAYRAQALQPSVMTFQLSETMLQPVDDPENRLMLRSLLNMSIVADEGEVAHPSSSPMCSFGSVNVQGPCSMRYQHDGENVIKTNQIRVPIHFTHEITSPSPHSPANPGPGDQRPPGSSKPQKRSKMHQCVQCKKLFPRPSGLATHMNTHSGAKPYKCIIPNCGKSFAVRSNAKRHLRTHGVNPSSPGILALPSYTVGFEKPMVTQVHDAGKQPSRLKWIAHNLSSQESEWFHPGPSSAVDDGMAFQASTSSSALSNSSDEDYDEAGSMGVVDGRPRQGEYKRDGDEYSGTYGGFGAHPR